MSRKQRGSALESDTTRVDREQKNARNTALDSRVVFKIFDRLCERWRLSRDQRCMLLGTQANIYRRWRAHAKSPSLSNAQIVRISHLVNLFDGLHRLFGDDAFADEWVHRANKAFVGRTPLALMLSAEPAGFKAVCDLIQTTLANV